ncbi:penicillin-binding protein [Paucilactobacillus kaifaensis]|uniref:penicillin-binding protein n=1 Tax=Paucilactobacillus kaifaensis TaxID=2559921 RepID=UPI0010FA1DAD|nr:penicillin-binding protein [Paucilactobacillus kaifaensis]
MNNHPKRTSSSKTRKNRKIFGQWLFFIVVALFTLLIVRFAYIGIFKDVKNVNLKSKAAQLYTQKRTITAKRGTIYDASGKAIAEDTSTYSIYAVIDHSQKTASGKPLYVTNKQKAATVLAKYLSISKAKALKVLTPSKPNVFQVEFGSAGANISVATKQAIEAKHLKGINFVASPAREYPNGTFASQIIGIAQAQTSTKTGKTTLVGQMGIELALNKQLTGTNGFKKVKQDTSGYQITGSQQTPKKAQNGDNVYTTLDNKLQTLLESQMTSAEKASKATSMNAIVMNAKTGAIVAATQRPTFNADTKEGLSKVWRNTLVEDAFEPGSTMKVFTMAAAINSGNFNPNAYYDSGSYEIGGGKVTDWNPTGWGSITYREGFERSSNVAMAHLENAMGAKTWKKYLNKFGFLKSTNSGLANEATGATPFKGALEQANTAFGQGITVTAMQMMQGFTAIANNGKMLKPYFIDKVVDPNTNKVVTKNHKKVVSTPITKKTAQQVRKYMQDVVYADKGTGSKYKISGYRIAGKTGTAQIGGASGYESGSSDYIYSFVGMAPAKNPKYIMYITLKKPQNTTQSAETYMAVVFKSVMKQALDQAKLANQKQTGVVKVPNVIGKKATSAQKLLTDKKLQVTVIGNKAAVTEQSIAAQNTAITNSRIFLTTGGTVTMPDLTDWSQAQVNQFAQLTGLKITNKGNGFAKKQSIKAGNKITKGQTIVVQYHQK